MSPRSFSLNQRSSVIALLALFLAATSVPAMADSGAWAAAILGGIQGAAESASETAKKEREAEKEKELIRYRYQLEQEREQRRAQEDLRQRQEENQKVEKARQEEKQKVEKARQEKEANSVSTGSGFFITSDGYFITNFHVIKNSKSVVLYTTDGLKTHAVLIRVDAVNDLAILKAEGRFSALPIASSRAAKRGQSVATVGYPHADVQGIEPKVTEGIISSLSGIADDPRMFQISVPIQSGNSGGPLITREGNVVGIIVSKLSAVAMLKETGDVTQNVNYAIKSNYLIELIETAELKSKPPLIKRKTMSLEEVTAAVERSTALVVASPKPLAEAGRLPTGTSDSPEERRKTDGSDNQANLRAGQTFRDCPDCPEIVILAPGSFYMGSNSGDTSPIHSVTISSAFAMGKTEVTQAQWRAVMGNYISKFTNCGDNCPAEQVSWGDAQAFIQKLNAKTGKQYRLPSESEWEYACRAGTHHEYCGSDNLDTVGWYGAEVSRGNSGISTKQVATKQANAWGLYDMSGNVWEWVEDSYHDNYNGAPTDGSVWQGDGAKRVLRGGSLLGNLSNARATERGSFNPAIRSGNFGFRLVRTLP